MEGRDVYFLVDGGSEIKLKKAERYSIALTDDYDKYNIIAMHVK